MKTRVRGLLVSVTIVFLMIVALVTATHLRILPTTGGGMEASESGSASSAVTQELY